MKVIFAYRYGILGGVATQLVNRMQFLKTVPGFEAKFFFLEDHGVGPTLAPYGEVIFSKRAEDITQIPADVAVVIDTRELLEAIKDPALVCEVHTTTEFGLAYLRQRSWNPELFVVPSSYSRDLLRYKFSIGERETVEVIPNIVDAALFHPSTRDELKPLAPHPIVLWVGKLDDHKNWELFLEIAGLFHTQAPDVEFWIAGGATAPEEVGLSMLEAAEGLSLLDRLRWFPHIDYAGMRRAYGYVAESGGCAVVTSKDESFGMSVAEALLSGCPVIASCVGALPELAPDRPYLPLYPFGDVVAALAHLDHMILGTHGSAARRALASDLSALQRRLAASTIGPRYLELLEGLHRRRRLSLG